MTVSAVVAIVIITLNEPYQEREEGDNALPIQETENNDDYNGIRASHRLTVSFSLVPSSSTTTAQSSTTPTLMLGGPSTTTSAAANTATTTFTTTLFAMHIRVETLLMVLAMVALFGLALFGLAYSMGGGDIFRCCCCRRKRSGNCDIVDGNDTTTTATTARRTTYPPTYETVQEFVFDAANDTTTVAMVQDVPTTMERLFPDLLSSSLSLSSSTYDVVLETMGKSNTENFGSGGGCVHTTNLREPLL